MNAKSNVTPFSDSKGDYMTDVTQAAIKSPTEMNMKTQEIKNVVEELKKEENEQNSEENVDPRETKITKELEESISKPAPKKKNKIEIPQVSKEEIDITPKAGNELVKIDNNEPEGEDFSKNEDSVRLTEQDDGNNSSIHNKSENNEMETPVRKEKKDSESSFGVNHELHSKSSADKEVANINKGHNGDAKDGIIQIDDDSDVNDSYHPKIQVHGGSKSSKGPTPKRPRERESSRINDHFESSHMALTENKTESSFVEDEAVEQKLSNKNLFKSRVSIVDIPKMVKDEFRLILQNKKIPFEKLIKIFPETKRVSLKQLIDHFKSFKRFEDDDLVEKVCRYLVENDANGDVIEFDMNADIDKIAIGNFH